MTRNRSGFTLVEVIVALTIFAVSMLGLGGAVAVAHRAFNSAGHAERSTGAAALVIDSLMRELEPASGERRVGPALVQWTVRSDTAVTRIELRSMVDSLRARPLEFHVTHHAR